MTNFTNKGEVMQPIDDDQFGSGESVMKCGPEAVALIWHSVAPGQENPYNAPAVHAMAHSDYERYIGPDNASDQAGTSNDVLYEMLDSHALKYKKLDLDWGEIRGWLADGYPVILGGVAESSVFDEEVGGVPYSWNTSGLYHIIVASGPGQDDYILVRDTANIGPSGVRPGPRRYRFNDLEISTVTLVVPSWLPAPASDTPPPVAEFTDAQKKEFADCWNTTADFFPGGKAPTMDSGIAESWRRAWIAGHQFGPPLSGEYTSNDFDDQPIVCQQFAGGRCEWQNGKARWFCGSGEIKF